MESRSLGEISRTSERNIKNHSNGRNWGRAKERIDESERGEWKSWLETQSKKINKTKILASSPITSWQIEGEKVEAETNLFSRAPELSHTVTASIELKDVCFLEGMLWQI